MRAIIRSVVLACVMCALPMAAAAQNLKVGVVNVQEVIIKSKTGSQVFAQMKAKFEAREKQLQAQGQTLKKTNEDIMKQSSLLSQDAMKAKITEFQTAYAKYQQEMQKYQEDRVNEENKSLGPLQKRMLEVTASYASKNGLSVVLDSATVPYFDASLDITKAIMAEFDKK